MEPRNIGRVLVLAAHPDDAELTVGGTIAYFRSLGAEVTVATFTTSASTDRGIELRRQAAERAATILGHRLVWVEQGHLNQVEDIRGYETVGLVDELVDVERPNIVLAPWEGDSHGDHVQLARAALASSRRWSASLFAYTPSELRTPCIFRFQPNTFVDITAFCDLKIAAIQAFNINSGDYRALETEQLVRQWSYFGSICGCEFAEGLLLLRQTWIAEPEEGNDG